MKNDNTNATRRGSSPPFQDPDQDFLKWLNGLRFLDQRDEKSSEILRSRQLGNTGPKPTDQKDESRWQNEGGESG